MEWGESREIHWFYEFISFYLTRIFREGDSINIFDALSFLLFHLITQVDLLFIAFIVFLYMSLPSNFYYL